RGEARHHDPLLPRPAHGSLPGRPIAVDNDPILRPRERGRIGAWLLCGTEHHSVWSASNQARRNVYAAARIPTATTIHALVCSGPPLMTAATPAKATERAMNTTRMHQ